MRSFGTLVLALFVSSIAAGVVQNLVAISSGAREEFIVAIMLLVLFAIVTTIALGVALGASKSVTGVDHTAFGLFIITGLAVVGLVALTFIADRKISLSARDLSIIAGIGVPTALMIAIQWWFVRRRWRRANAA